MPLTPEAIGEVVADCLCASPGGADALGLAVISQDGRRLVWITKAGEVPEQLPDRPMDVPAATTDAAIETADYVVRHLEELTGVADGASDRPARLRDFCRRCLPR